jgi:hypothetical protein
MLPKCRPPAIGPALSLKTIFEEMDQHNNQSTFHRTPLTSAHVLNFLGKVAKIKVRSLS